MKKNFTYRKTGQVVMIHDEKPQHENYIELDISEEDLEKFREGCLAHITDKKINFTESPFLKNKRKKEKMYKDLKNPTLKLEDLKELLIELLD